MSKIVHFKVQFRKPPEKGWFTLEQNYCLGAARHWVRVLRTQGKKFLRIRRVVTTTRTVW